jgi:hypothetical protein
VKGPELRLVVLKTHPLPAYLCAYDVELHRLEMPIIMLHSHVEDADQAVHWKASRMRKGRGYFLRTSETERKRTFTAWPGQRRRKAGTICVEGDTEEVCYAGGQHKLKDLTSSEHTSAREGDGEE